MSRRNENREEEEPDRKRRLLPQSTFNVSFTTPRSVANRIEAIAWRLNIMEATLVRRAVEYVLEYDVDLTKFAEETAMKEFLMRHSDEQLVGMRTSLDSKVYHEVLRRAKNLGLDRREFLNLCVAYYCLYFLKVKVKKKETCSSSESQS